MAHVLVCSLTDLGTHGLFLQLGKNGLEVSSTEQLNQDCQKFTQLCFSKDFSVEVSPCTQIQYSTSLLMEECFATLYQNAWTDT